MVRSLYSGGRLVGYMPSGMPIQGTATVTVIRLVGKPGTHNLTGIVTSSVGGIHIVKERITVELRECNIREQAVNSNTQNAGCVQIIFAIFTPEVHPVSHATKAGVIVVRRHWLP